MQYFCLTREIVETIMNFPPVPRAWRKVNFYLKDGSVRAEVDVIGNEFYALNEDQHKYFEPSDISFVEQA